FADSARQQDAAVDFCYNMMELLKEGDPHDRRAVFRAVWRHRICTTYITYAPAYDCDVTSTPIFPQKERLCFTNGLAAAHRRALCADYIFRNIGRLAVYHKLSRPDDRHASRVLHCA